MRTGIKKLVVGLMCSVVYFGSVWSQQAGMPAGTRPGGAPGAPGAGMSGTPAGTPGQSANVVTNSMVAPARQPGMPPVQYMQGEGPQDLGVSTQQSFPAQESMPSTGQITAQPEQQPEPENKPAEEVEEVAQDRPTGQSAMASEMKGIDTLEIDEPGGNWLVKRMWWEKAEEKMEKIDASIEVISDSRTAFYDKRDQLDAQLFDPFYAEIGLDQGQLEEVIIYLLNELQQKREKETALDREALEFRKKIEAEKQVLEDLKNDVVAIQKLDASLDEALDKLVEQINLTKKYRKDAQQLFKDIANVLDHEKAREYYYRLDAAWQNIKGVQEYISGKFTEYFDQLDKKAHDQVARIKSVMNDLAKKGLNLKDQYKQRKTDEQKKEEERLLAQKRAEEEAAAKAGFWTKAWGVIAAPFKVVWGWFTSFGQWISSFWKSGEPVTQEEAVESEKKTEQTPVPASAPSATQAPAQVQPEQESAVQAVAPTEHEQKATVQAPADRGLVLPARVETRRMMGSGVQVPAKNMPQQQEAPRAPEAQQAPSAESAQ